MNRVINNTELSKSYLQAIITYNFLKDYANLENLIKNEFINAIKSETIDSEKISKLWFYIGGTRTKSYIDYNNHSLVQQKIPYTEETLKSSFTFNNIIRINKKEKFVEKFNTTIQLINNREHIDFFTVCDKLIKMRNKLAHEINKDLEGEKVIIELISHENIVKQNIEWLSNIDLTQISNSNQVMLSNYIYMIKIMQILEE